MAHVNTGTEIRKVRNLGWLLRHWRGVERFTFEPIPDREDHADGWLIAHMVDGSVYFTRFMSASVCADWLHRPVFRGLPLTWYGKETVC